MSKDSWWWSLIAVTAVGFAFLIQVPQFLHVIDSRYQGVLVHLNSDEYVYQARVEEAMHRPKQTAEAIIGDPKLLGSQFAFLEETVGILFSWTGWRAPTVLQVMDFVVGFLFLSLLWFFRQCGFSRWYSYGGAAFFMLLELNNLNRPIHPAGSFLLMLTSLNLLIAGSRGRTFLGVLGGAVLGTLVGVYVWSWTFAWIWWGLFVSLSPRERVTRPNDPVRPPGQWSVRTGIGRGVRGILFTLIGAITALPFLWQLYRVMQHPLYEEAVFRSGMFPSRMPESIPYSVLFAGMAVSVGVFCFSKWKTAREYRPAIITVFAAFIVIHQQIIHGITFNFVSHYLFSLILAGVCMLLLLLHTRSKFLVLGAACAAIYLTAVGYDGRWVLKQLSVDEGDFANQYLVTSFHVLDALERQTILTDPIRSLFLAANTKHDVLYTVYVKNVLIPHTEIAERYCLTVLPLPPRERHSAEQEWLIYPDAVRAFAQDPSIREREVAMVEEACSRIDRDPVTYLKKYGVTTIFWDEKLNPRWELKRLKVPLKKVEQGEGWSLWSMAVNLQ